MTILAAVGVGAPLWKSSAPPTQTGHSAALTESRRQAAYAHSAADLILDFFDCNSKQYEPNKPWSAESDPRGCLDDTATNYQVRFLIATVPDPDSVPLRYKFDSFLNAISEAANIAGFNL